MVLQQAQAVKNIARKVLNLYDRTFNQRLSGLIKKCLEVRNDFIQHQVW